MEIKNFNDLKKIILLCRRQGVQSIKIGTLELHLGAAVRQKQKQIDYSSDIPEANVQIPKFTGEIAAPDPVTTDELTEEQLMFYSVGNSSVQGPQ